MKTLGLQRPPLLTSATIHVKGHGVYALGTSISDGFGITIEPLEAFLYGAFRLLCIKALCDLWEGRVRLIMIEKDT